MFKKINLLKYKPTKLKRIAKEISTFWVNSTKEKSIFELQIIVSKVIDFKVITFDELVVCFFNILKIQSILKKRNYLLSNFINNINLDKNTITKDREIFEDIYEILLLFYKKRAVEIALKKFIIKYNLVNYEKSKKTAIYKKYMESGDNFINYMYKKLSFAIINNFWVETIEYYEINLDRRIYQDIFIMMLNNISEYLRLFNENINKIVSIILKNMLPKIDRIRVYKEILNFYIEDNVEINKFSNDIMLIIFNDLGDPIKKPNNYIEFNEIQIEVMKTWIINRDLIDIFSIKIQDKDRLEFWKQYIKYIQKIEYIEDLSQAIIIETKKDTFVEFGIVGNALYIYKGKHLEEFKKSKSIEKLKDRTKGKAYSHIGNWQFNFKKRLWSLGYEVGTHGKNRWYDKNTKKEEVKYNGTIRFSYE